MISDFAQHYSDYAQSQGASQFAWLENLFINHLRDFHRLKEFTDKFVEGEADDEKLVEQLAEIQMLYDHFRWKKGLIEEPKDYSEVILYDKILMFQFNMRLINDLFSGKAEIEARHPDDDLSWKWKVTK
jgi:hypothetical protein